MTKAIVAAIDKTRDCLILAAIRSKSEAHMALLCFIVRGETRVRYTRENQGKTADECHSL